MSANATTLCVSHNLQKQTNISQSAVFKGNGILNHLSRSSHKYLIISAILASLFVKAFIICNFFTKIIKDVQKDNMFGKTAMMKNSKRQYSILLVNTQLDTGITIPCGFASA